MANELAGKVAIVTGGTAGIGAATAEVFAEEGASVVIAGRGIEAGEATAARLGSNVRFMRADVASRDDLQALVDFAVAEFGRLDVMVNNAAITGNFHNRFLDDDLADFDEVLRTDLGEYGVRVNAIAPGHIPTRLNDFGAPGLTDEQNAELTRVIDGIYTSDQPLARRGAPRDVANAALFFASDRSAYVTGQVIAVDGGVTAGSAVNMNAMLKAGREGFLESLKAPDGE